MNILMPYGRNDVVKATLTQGRCLGTLDIANTPAIGNLDEALRAGLEKPIGQSAPVMASIGPSDTVAITVSDQFRVTAVDRILPSLLHHLARAGVPDSRIIFVVATGTHRPPTPDEQRAILGPAVYDRFQASVYNHNPNDDANLKFIGETPRGTRVRVNRRVAECSRIIVTGACVLHYFGGFGGGRKGIVPGIASVDTIAHNHAMNLDPVNDRINPAVRIGVLDGNPVAEDMMDAARLLPVTCLINTVLNRTGEVAGLFIGDLEKAHREAAAFARRLFAVAISERADLVIASSGGTRNFVQSHKALYNAHQTLKPGGRIVLAAQCAEGLGGDQFVKWIRLRTREAVIAGLRKQSEINGQTALSTLEKAPHTHFVTDLSEGDVALLGGIKARDLQHAIDGAVQLVLQTDFTYYLMPSAAYTVPLVKGEEAV